MKYTNMLKYKNRIYKENKNKIGVYRLTCNKNGKIYIGSSVNLSRRFSHYYSNKTMLNKLKVSKSFIYSALLKHGHVNFSLEILEYCEKDVLIEREQYYMDLLKPEYNICKIAGSRFKCTKVRK
jgi:group I intron endonuclease